MKFDLEVIEDPFKIFVKRFCDFKKIVGPNDNLNLRSYEIFCPFFLTSNNVKGTF